MNTCAPSKTPPQRVKGTNGQKNTNAGFSRKINDLIVKQSLHTGVRGFTRPQMTVSRRMCTTFPRKTRGGTANPRRVKSPAGRRGHVSWRASGHPRARHDGVPPLKDPGAANAALTAFLRGVERRGAVFAEWQAGGADAGDKALAATLRGFREIAAGSPFAEWPRRFWAMLLASPHLRAGPVPGANADHPPHLVALGSGPRAALLLRVVAGLAEGEAAAVLGIARPTYRMALRQALPRLEDGAPDPEAWRALSSAAQQAVRGLPAERLQQIALLRDGGRARPVRKPSAAMPGRPRWLWPATVAVLLLTAAALAATWWPWSTGLGEPGNARIQVDALPEAAAPAARFDPATALEAHRDLALLLDQAEGRFDELSDPAFDAWLAAGADAGDPGGVPLPDQAPLGDVATDADSASQEQFDAPR